MPMHPEYRSMWVSAGYSRFMGSAEVVPPPPAQFLRVYHLLPAAFGLSDIALRRIKLARFGDLNDPFELLAVNCRKRRFQAALQEHNRNLSDTTGLLCFSKDWTNPVLWSHYGDKHAGICLGFDMVRGREEPVSYADQRLLAELGDGKAKPLISVALENELRRTKFSHWGYEQEVRLFTRLTAALQEGLLFFVPLGPELRLAEVILGERCQLDLVQVRNLVSTLHPQATTFRSRLAVKSFGIVPDEDTVP